MAFELYQRNELDTKKLGGEEREPALNGHETKEYSPEIMEQIQNHDLTTKMIPFLDKHLVILLLEFLSIKSIYRQEELLQAKYDLFLKTNLFDYAKFLWMEINNCDDEEQVPKVFEAKHKDMLDRMAGLEKTNNIVTKLLEKNEVVQQLRQDKFQNVKFLKEKHGLTNDLVDNIFQFGMEQYESGNYAGAADLLYHFRALSLDAEKNAIATWGKLASEILYTAWDDAIQELAKLREHIENKNYDSSSQQLLHRTWLLHWSLFPFFNHSEGRETLCEMFFSPSFLNTIQTCCPWLLRYLAVAVITLRSVSRFSDSNISSSSYHKKVKDLVNVITQEQYEYTDPIINFLSYLYVDYDFEKAQSCLLLAKSILQHDFFLASLTDEFLENSRQLMAECYCRIHHRINIDSLAKSLDFTPDQVIRLIHDEIVDLSAKIDIKEGTIVLNRPPHSVYQQVIEKTKAIILESQVMTQMINKRDFQEAIEA